MSAQTPMAKLVRRGRRIITIDHAGSETLVSVSPDADKALWLFGALSTFHGGTPVEETDSDDDLSDALAQPITALLERIGLGLPFCPHEHTVSDVTGDGPQHRGVGHGIVVEWRCSGWAPDHPSKQANLGPRTSRDESDAIRATVVAWTNEHERAVAEATIADLIMRLEGAVLMLGGLTHAVHDFVAEASNPLGVHANDDVVERGKRAVSAAVGALAELQMQGVG